MPGGIEYPLSPIARFQVDYVIPSSPPRLCLAHSNSYYPHQAVHIVWDNLNTHRAAVWEGFNEKHGGRFHFYFTPIHASWVNQIELLFGIFSRRVLRNASHTSTEHLRDRTLAWFLERSLAPKPFKWSFKGYHLQTGEPKKTPGRKADAATTRRRS